MTPLIPPKLRLDSINTSYDLNLRLEITTPPDSPRLGIASPESPKSFNINKCPSCFKSVFQVEEVSCGGSYWHVSCFKCGGPGELGCQRRLSPADFHLHSLTPYCKPCYSRVLSNISSPDIELVDTIQAACSGSARSELPELLDIVKVEKRASIFGPSRRSSTIESNLVLQNRVLCPKCSKTVFKVEEVLATGFIWHQSCFQCGGVNEEVGCHRVLGREDFLQDRGIPFCKACFSRRITSKNFELLNTCTSSCLSKYGFATEYSFESDNLDVGGDGDIEEEAVGIYVIDQELEKERKMNNFMRGQKYASVLAALSDDEDEDELCVRIETQKSSPNSPNHASPRTPSPSPFPSPDSPRLSPTIRSSSQPIPLQIQAVSFPNYSVPGTPSIPIVKSGDRTYDVFFIFYLIMTLYHNDVIISLLIFSFN